jgi:hypothetical protein
MDYDIISDKAGKCPPCGLKLKEVSLKVARENLIKVIIKSSCLIIKNYYPYYRNLFKCIFVCKSSIFPFNI